MSLKLVAGDVVQLKSGGPLLTVVSATAKEVTGVYYKDVDGTFANFTLPTAVLDKIDLADDEDLDDEIDD